MNLKKLALAAAAGATLLAAAPVFADHRDHWRDQSHGWRAPQHRPHHAYGHHYGHHYGPRYGHYRERSYYAPPPRAYYYEPPAPVYYAPSRPVYYAPSPTIHGRVPLGHGASIGFSLPLDY